MVRYRAALRFQGQMSQDWWGRWIGLMRKKIGVGLSFDCRGDYKERSGKESSGFVGLDDVS